MHLLRKLSMLAAVAAAFAAPLSAQVVDTTSLTEGTTGDVFTITGSGFGVKKPKVELIDMELDKKAKGSSLKVLENSDTSLTVEIKKAKAGDFGLRVRPKGKGIDPADSEDGFTIMPITNPVPEAMAGDPGEIVRVDAEFMGSKPAKVKVGGKKAAVKKKDWFPNGDAEGGGGYFLMKLPKKLANGNYQIEFKSKTYEVMIPDFIEIENSTVGLPKPGKAKLSAKIGGKGFKATLQQQLVYLPVTIGMETATNFNATAPGGNPRTIMFSIVYDPAEGGAATISGDDILSIGYGEGLFPNNSVYAHANDFVVNIAGVVGDQLIGSFSGTFNKVSGPGAETLAVVNGEFVLNPVTP